MLCRCSELLNNIYVVEKDGHSATKAMLEDALPWPVVLLLGSHSRRHIFARGRQLPMQEVERSCNDFANRVKWRWHFRKRKPEIEAEKLKHKQLVKRRPREYRGRSLACIENLALAVANEVKLFCKTANSRIARNRERYRMPGFVISAPRWLDKLCFAVVPSDKDGVFTLCRRGGPREFDYGEISEQLVQSSE